MKSWKDADSFWSEFSSRIKGNNRFYVDEEYLQEFDRIIDNTNYCLVLFKGTVLCRARIHTDDKRDDSTPYEPKLMGPPPKNKLSSGRLNPVGINYLYLAKEMETCIYEVKPYIGDRITVGIFETGKKETKILNLCDDQPFPSAESLTTQIAARIATDYSRPINPSNELDYLPTQFFSEYVKRKGFDGIQYGSSINKGGKNVTLFKSEHAKCQETMSVKIDQIRYVWY
jgi:hypothetical protein